MSTVLKLCAIFHAFIVRMNFIPFLCIHWQGWIRRKDCSEAQLENWQHNDWSGGRKDANSNGQRSTGWNIWVVYGTIIKFKVFRGVLGMILDWNCCQNIEWCPIYLIHIISDFGKTSIFLYPLGGRIHALYSLSFSAIPQKSLCPKIPRYWQLQYHFPVFLKEDLEKGSKGKIEYESDYP